MTAVEFTKKLNKSQLIEIARWVNKNSDHTLNAGASRNDLIASLTLCLSEDILSEAIEEVLGVFFGELDESEDDSCCEPEDDDLDQDDDDDYEDEDSFDPDDEEE